MKNLVIVESPAKGKTIEKYLGKDYTVKASVGHIRDLAKKEMGIDMETFEPTYIVSSDKKKIVSELKKLAKQAEEVLIATDEDREGEAIGWHICQALGLDVETTKRISFREITKSAIQSAIKNPGKIDMDTVNAQQARRVLDRVVGFEVSPVLWRKIPGNTSLSAGRVQSVAVRLIVDREKEINAFVPTESWKLRANVTHGVTDFVIEFSKKDGKVYKPKSQAEAEDLVSSLQVSGEVMSEKDSRGWLQLHQPLHEAFSLVDIVTRDTKRSPTAPFITSTLQQEASRKLGWGVKQTMGVAQSLYQNGHITYMRTDSTNLSQEARDNAAAYISANYGSEYVHSRNYTTKDDKAQEAHEAIRPSYLDKAPGSNGLTDTDAKLYELIWKRTMASQMAQAKVQTTTYSFSPVTDTSQLWEAKGKVILFDGFMKLYIEGTDDEKKDDNQTLPQLSKGDDVQGKQMHLLQQFTRPPARYTEATLVKKLESEGIGRPSTYAPTIGTIIDRGYIEKKNKYLHPTTLAKLVTEFLEKHFEQMMDYKFTASVEDMFDEVEAGKQQWQDFMKTFYKDFHPLVDVAMEQGERVSGERELGTDPDTGKPIIVRLAKFGPVVQLGKKEKEDDVVKYAGIPSGIDMAEVTLEQALELFKLPRELGDMNGKILKANLGRFGPYVQLGSTFASLPKKFDEGVEPYDVFSISYEQGRELMEAKIIADEKKKISFFEDSGVEVLNGRWGPFIKYQKKNFKLDKEQKEKAADLTEAQCLRIIEEQGGVEEKKKGTKKTTKKKPVAKKKTAKKVTKKK